MKQILFLFLLLYSIAFSKTSPLQDYNLQCDTFSLQAEISSDIFFDKRKKEYDHKYNKESMKLTITNLNFNNPKLLGNNGSTDLYYTGGNSINTFYLMEITLGGYIVVYTFFTKEKKFIMTKQYNFIGSPYTLTVFGNYSCY